MDERRLTDRSVAPSEAKRRERAQRSGPKRGEVSGRSRRTFHPLKQQHCPGTGHAPKRGSAQPPTRRTVRRPLRRRHHHRRWSTQRSASGGQDWLGNGDIVRQCSRPPPPPAAAAAAGEPEVFQPDVQTCRQIAQEPSENCGRVRAIHASWRERQVEREERQVECCRQDTEWWGQRERSGGRRRR